MYHTYVDETNTGQVFYVGMGDDARISRRYGRNKHHTHVAKKYGQNRRIVSTFSEREDAVKLEVQLIAEFHTFVDDPAYNGIGCNYTKGGEGCACSEETRKKIGEANKGKTPWNKGKKIGPSPLEWRLKQSAAQLGQAPTRGMTGKAHSDETRAKMRKPHRCSKCGSLGHKSTTCESVSS